MHSSSFLYVLLFLFSHAFFDAALAIVAGTSVAATRPSRPTAAGTTDLRHLLRFAIRAMEGPPCPAGGRSFRPPHRLRNASTYIRIDGKVSVRFRKSAAAGGQCGP